MAWIGPTIAAGAGIVGGMMSGSGQAGANRTNIRMQREQQAWEERMSNSAVTRRVADMRAAGINPMLAGGAGGSADTPNVAPAQVQNEKEGVSRGIQSGINSAIAARQLKLMDAQTQSVLADAELKRSQIPVSGEMAALSRDELKSRVDNLRATFDSIVEGTAKTMTEAENIRQTMPVLIDFQKVVTEGAKLSNVEKKALADLYNSVKGMKGAEKLMPIILKLLEK